MKQVAGKAVRRRNRAATYRIILNAVDVILRDEGLEGLGINRVSTLAGVSKVLIYRYFGGLEGLLTRYIQEKKFFDRSALPETGATWSALLEHFCRLKQEPQALEMISTLVCRNTPLAAAAGLAMEAELRTLVEHWQPAGTKSEAALGMLLLTSLTHLSIMTHLKRPVLGMDSDHEASWRQLGEAVQWLQEATAAPRTAPTERYRLEISSMAA